MSGSRTLLHLDTTSHQLHVALSRAGQVLAEWCQPCESHRYHSALLVPTIQKLLNSTGLTVSELTALAVNQGPGSFTGIRTGIITARTMAQFLGIPVYQFNAFELLSAEHQGPLSIYLDALRGRAYQATLCLSESGTQYLQPPRLVQLPLLLEADSQVKRMVSPALAEQFFQGPVLTTPQEWRPPEAMLRLITLSPEAYQRSWQEVRPLYIQEPSITLKKGQENIPG